VILKAKYKKIFTLAISFLFLFPTTLAFAASDYIPLESSVPGIVEAGRSGSNLGAFLNKVFQWGISLAVALALIMIIWGGIEYMTTDSWSGKDDGKTKIQNAFYGLGLALISWLLLYTINPCLVDFTGSDKCKTPNTFLSPTSQSVNTGATNTGGNNNISVNTGTNTSNNGPIDVSTPANANTIGGSTNSSGSGGSSGSGSGCYNCVNVSTLGLAYKNGSQLNSDLARALQTALSGQSVQITEAWPPTADRPAGTCHDNGTCADVNFTNGSTNVNDVKNLYDRLTSAGLNASYEVTNISLCQGYIDAGIPCISTTYTTGSHFHVTM
jgi:hypothetical protein